MATRYRRVVMKIIKLADQLGSEDPQIYSRPRQGRAANATNGLGRERVSLTERAAFSPAEFAALFGRSPTWAYRQIYAGRVRPIADCGRLLIPRSELDSFLARKAEYNPLGGVGR
jgi:Helix-turn-helix domain